MSPEIQERLAKLQKTVIEVHDDNWPAVMTYQLCSWEWIGLSGMSKSEIIPISVSAMEVKTCAEALEYRFDANLLHEVQIMVQATRAVRNGGNSQNAQALSEVPSIRAPS